MRLRIKPAGSTTAVTSRTSIRISVFGPRGCPREVVAYCRGPWCVLSFEAVAYCVSGATGRVGWRMDFPSGRRPGCRSAMVPRTPAIYRDPRGGGSSRGSAHSYRRLQRVLLDQNLSVFL